MWDPMGLPSTRDPIRSLVQGAASSSAFHLAYAHHLLMQVKMLMMMMVLNRCAYNYIGLWTLPNRVATLEEAWEGCVAQRLGLCRSLGRTLDAGKILARWFPGLGRREVKGRVNRSMAILCVWLNNSAPLQG